MCRFVLYLGPPLTLGNLVTEPSNSLIYQSYQSHERAEPLNGDGFGIAWYVPELSDEPAVFRSISPAWSNRNLRELARVTRSGCILAHVRAATQDATVSEANCHPFTRGRFAFMHNGDVGGFQRIRRKLLDKLSDEAFGVIEGTTDSEHVFALFLDHHRAASSPDPAERMAAALRATIADVLALVRGAGITEPSYLNIAVTDGCCAVVARYTSDPRGRAESLHVTSGRRYTCTGGVCRMVHPPGEHSAAIVSSEPLSDDPEWETVPVNHLVVIGGDRTVRIAPLTV